MSNFTGISDLAQAIYTQAIAHSKDPTKDNWVNATPATGQDLSTPDPRKTQVYRWSDATKQAMTPPGQGPLTTTLQYTKNDPELQNWSYVIQSGTTTVGGTNQPARGCSPGSIAHRPDWPPSATETGSSS